MKDWPNYFGGGWTRKDIMRHRAKIRAQWLASLSNRRRRWGRP